MGAWCQWRVTDQLEDKIGEKGSSGARWRKEECRICFWHLKMTVPWVPKVKCARRVVLDRLGPTYSDRGHSDVAGTYSRDSSTRIVQRVGVHAGWGCNIFCLFLTNILYYSHIILICVQFTLCVLQLMTDDDDDPELTRRASRPDDRPTRDQRRYDRYVAFVHLDHVSLCYIHHAIPSFAYVHSSLWPRGDARALWIIHPRHPGYVVSV